MPRAKKGKAAKTVVKTGVTTGTAVALLFLSASAAFAAAAFTKPGFKGSVIRPINLPAKEWVDPQQTAGRGAAKLPGGRLPGSQATYILNAALDGDTPRSTILIAGRSDIPVAQFKLTAVGSDFSVRKLRLIDTAGTNTFASQLKIYDGVTLLGQSATVNGVVELNLNWSVPVNTAKILTVKADLRPQTQPAMFHDLVIGLDAGGLEAIAATSGATQTVFSSGQTACGTTTGFCAYPMKVYKTKPTVTLSADSPAGPTVSGPGAVLKFNISADLAGGLEAQQFTFRLNSTDYRNTGWNRYSKLKNNIQLRDRSDLEIALGGNWEFFDSQGNVLSDTRDGIVTRIHFGMAPAIAVAAGATKTLVVTMDLREASSNPDNMNAVRLDLLSGSEEEDARYLPGGMQIFGWKYLGMDDWGGGQYIRQLPLTGGTLIVQ